MIGTKRNKANKYAPWTERWWFKYVIATAVLCFITFLVAWSLGVFSVSHPKDIYLKLSDAFFVTGFVAFFQILRAAVIKGGLLDKVASFFGKIFYFFSQDKIGRKYNNFGNYRKALRERQPSYIFLLIVGFLFMVIGGVFLYAFSVA